MDTHDITDKDAFYTNTKTIYDKYLAQFPDEAERLSEFKKQLDNPAIDIRLRSTIPEGHVCASGIILLPGSKVLMLEHKALGIWVVPGGHYDLSDGKIENAAIREASEETGISHFELHPWHLISGMPLDIDTHPIPERIEKNEGAHQHFDFRYVLTVDNPDKVIESLQLDAGEVLNFKEMPLDEIDPASSIAPAIEKLRLLL